MSSAKSQLRRRFIVALIVLPVFAIVPAFWDSHIGPVYRRWRDRPYLEARSAYAEACDAGDPEEAALHLAELIELTEGQAIQAHYRIERAECLFQQGRRDEANEEYRVLFATADADEARRSRATMLKQAGDLDACKADLLAIETPSGWDSVWLALYQEPAARVESCSAAIRFFEEFPPEGEIPVKLQQAYGMRDVARLQLGEHRKALRDAQKAIESGDDSGSAYAVRAYAYALVGNHDDATADMQRAILIDGKTEFLLLTRAKLEVVRQDFAAATATVEKALELFPESREGRDILGLLQVGNGDGLQHLTPGGIKLLGESLWQSLTGSEVRTPDAQNE